MWAMRAMRAAGLVATLLWAGAARATEVVEVRVDGLRRVDRAAALAGTKLGRGATFDEVQATADLRAVWATGFFRDVRIDREPAGAGVRLIYTVAEKPTVRAVRFVGRDAISEEDLKGAVDVRAHTILSTEQLARNVGKIKDLYVSKGYYLAEVTYRTEPVGPKDAGPADDDGDGDGDGDDPADTAADAGDVDLIFEITENDRVVVRQIAIIGNAHLSSDAIKAAMQTREGNEISWLTQAGTYKEEHFQTDLLRIQALYFDHGYVQVKVGQPQATISRDRTAIYLTVPVEEGPQFHIGKIGFSGEVDLPAADDQPAVDAERLRRLLTVREHETFSRTQLFSDVQAVTDVYRDAGYAYANVTPNSQVDPDDRRVDLDIEIDRGEVVTFERIEISGNSRTRDKVIRRELRIVEGERYSAALLNLSRSRIFQLGYFETVELTTARGSAPDRMVVTVQVKEKSTGTFQIGAGFSSYESFIATAQISQNNFLGHGQILSLSMQLSFGDFARQLATFQFFEPYFLDTHWSLGLNAYITQRYYRDFQRNARGLAPSFGYPLTHELRVNAGYTLEQVEIATDKAFGNAVLHNLSRAGRVSSVNGNVSFDTRDNRLFPTSGTFEELRLEVSSPYLGADRAMAFKRLEFDARVYVPVVWSVVLKLNLQLGWVFGAEDGVPISERYFPGGIYSVRGFEPRGLGPTLRVATDAKDPTAPTRDFVIGGNKQAIVNLEVEFPIVAAAGIKGVVFADAGNAFNDNEALFYLGTPRVQRSQGYLIGSGRPVDVPLGLFSSVGFGFRWFSPIGPLRFEWGVPLTKHEPDGRPIIFEFTIGNFF